MSVKRALVCGAGGFIGSHLVRNLKQRRLLGSRRGSEISGVQSDCR